MRRTLFISLALVASLALSACATSRTRSRGVTIERGIASWYGPGFHGRQTASGERYNMHAMTAAHQTLPFGTVVEVRNLESGKTARVKINDRGPFVGNRIIDLSKRAAQELGIYGPGTALVELVAVGLEPIGGFSFTVQLGAFRDIRRAESLAEQVRDDYPEVTVRSDGVWSRVQLGAFTNRKDALRFAHRLSSRGLDAVVVPLALVDRNSSWRRPNLFDEIAAAVPQPQPSG